MERPSEHPLAGAFVTAARERSLVIPDVAGFASVPGRGVSGAIDCQLVTVGRPSPALDSGSRPGTEVILTRMAQAGGTAVVVTIDAQPVGVLALTDRLRPGAVSTLRRLTSATAAPPVLLNGDNTAAARQIAGDVGVSDVRADQLPADKVAAVRALAADGGHVTVVGDGLNEAPALAAGGTDIAMGRAVADLTLDAADVVIVRDELATIPAVIGLSRHARRIIKQNLVFAATVIAALITLDLAGHLPLPLGVAGHEGSTVLDGLNGLRLPASQRRDVLQSAQVRHARRHLSVARGSMRTSYRGRSRRGPSRLRQRAPPTQRPVAGSVSRSGREVACPGVLQPR